MLELNANPLITCMTTNPTLMRKAGLTDFDAFARDILASIAAKPLSPSVFSDEFPEMKRQALKINGWAKVLNIFQANDCGCRIITVPHDILGKALKMAGMDLDELSLDTVKMFANDAKAAGLSL